jgi:hypothetical protein
MNLKPRHYDWVDFYDKVIDLTQYSFSRRAMYRRLMANRNFTARWMNFMRAISQEGFGRIRFYKKVRHQLLHDRSFSDYFEGVHHNLPLFYIKILQKDLGVWWQWFPKQALEHDAYAYLHKKEKPFAEPLAL